MTDTGTAVRRAGDGEALELLFAGRRDDAVELVEDTIRRGELDAMLGEMVAGMGADDLGPAGELARIIAEARHAGSLPGSPRTAPKVAETPDPRRLSRGKLVHDIDQLSWLRDRGLVGAEVDRAIARCRELVSELESLDVEARTPVPADDAIASLYGRLSHLRPTPRVPQALSDSWSGVRVEDAYLADRLGLVVVDDFLAPDALAELRAFCLESTVWNSNRYPHGRLGAFFDRGFSCPLLLQIAEELRARFPRVIGDRHGLRQLWGFKYPSRMPGSDSVHADFAAVNVNFWITPTEANLDPSSGGLLVYDIDAPRDWDFETYNRRPDLIEQYLRRHGARGIHIPYRANRAIIFNSDLFHATEDIDFAPAYEDRRINVTMLYGVREHDERHLGGNGAASGVVGGSEAPAWRSAALARRRR